MHVIARHLIHDPFSAGRRSGPTATPSAARPADRWPLRPDGRHTPWAARAGRPSAGSDSNDLCASRSSPAPWIERVACQHLFNERGARARQTENEDWSARVRPEARYSGEEVGTKDFE